MCLSVYAVTAVSCTLFNCRSFNDVLSFRHLNYSHRPIALLQRANFRHSAETTKLFGRNRIFAESHRSIFGRKRNLPKQFKLLSSAPKPNFVLSLGTSHCVCVCVSMYSCMMCNDVFLSVLEGSQLSLLRRTRK